MQFIRQIEADFLKAVVKKPVTILYGARQVGKTTFVKAMLSHFGKTLYMQGDDPRDKDLLQNRSTVELKSLTQGYSLLIVDEAQQVENIGTTLKLLADNVPELRIIATGSSSFELANKLNEPLTGRNRKFYLFPLSIPELVAALELRTLENNLETYIRFGSYPEVILAEAEEEKKEALQHLTMDYLFKDLFQFSHIKNPFIFEKLIRLLALRIGSEVSYAELAKEIGISRDTVYSYITLLEQAFIVFRLTPLYSNKIKEINKNHKIYFYDTGIRNAILRAFDPLDLRTDKGALFENFFIAEKVKEWTYSKRETEIHFWRNRQGSEVDFVESKRNGSGDVKEIVAYECKWKDSSKMPLAFEHLYPAAHFQAVTAQNIVKLMMSK